jgi:anti-anti-sigma regulatory factor
MARRSSCGEMDDRGGWRCTRTMASLANVARPRRVCRHHDEPSAFLPSNRSHAGPFSPIACLMHFTTLKSRDVKPSRSAFFSIINKNGMLTLRPTGPSLTEREAIIISTEVKPIMERFGGGMRGLVLDLSEIKVMSSFGLGMCIELRNTAKTFNASTIILGLCEELTELFCMLKVDRLYTMVRNSKELAKAMAA